MRPKTPQQAAVIAIRRSGKAVEVCLTRKPSKRWGIPKGFVDPGDTPEETALNEAWEEAGLKGRLLGGVVGTYEYEKWSTTLVVALYVMEVLEEDAVWQEAHIRERRWLPLAKAMARLKDHPVRPLLSRAEALLTRI